MVCKGQAPKTAITPPSAVRDLRKRPHEGLSCTLDQMVCTCNDVVMHTIPTGIARRVAQLTQGDITFYLGGGAVYASVGHHSGAVVLSHTYRRDAATEGAACLRVAGSDLARMLDPDPGVCVDASGWEPGDPELIRAPLLAGGGHRIGRVLLARSSVLALAAWPTERLPVTVRGAYPVIGDVVTAPAVAWERTPRSLPRAPFTAALASGVRCGTRTEVAFTATHALVVTPFAEISHPLF
jgi:hypothetical protein